MVGHTIEVSLECYWFYLQIVQECKQNSWKKIFKKKQKKKKKKKKTYFLEIQLKEGTYDLKNKNM
jgi:hypothetical protein